MPQLIKRWFDIWVAAAGLLLSLPILICVASAVRASMGWPVFFRQVRPGYKGRPFTLIKFRTMSQAQDADGNLLTDAERLTRLGFWLRRLSLDELPELWNVLRGEMSLVGPRPLLMEYLDRYTLKQARRHEVKPGMTGWAQVHGRQDLPFSQRLDLDVWYVEHLGVWLDFQILGLTVLQVVSGSGVRPGQDVREVDDLQLHPTTQGTQEGIR